MSENTDFWIGGYLNKDEIHENLDKVFVSGTVANPREQIQQAGIDLTLDEVYLAGRRMRPSGNEGWYYLPKGAYIVKFREIAKRTRTFGLSLHPRSTHFRDGGTIDCGGSKSAYLRSGRLYAVLTVENPYGIRLQRGVRLAQAAILSSRLRFRTPHHPVAVSERLTIEKIFAYRSEGVLGVDERGVELEEIERAVLGYGQAYLLRFAETVKVGIDEVVWSFSDAPHREVQQGFGSTMPQASPFNGLMTMGAVADPGYHGKLHACVYSFWNQQIQPGIPLIRLGKHSITPITSEGDLYNGKYQGIGVTANEPETVVWGTDMVWALH